MIYHVLIAIYGDSLSLPRGQDGIRHFDTYGERLRDGLESSNRNTRVGILNRSRAGTPISVLHQQYLQDHAYVSFDGETVLVLQCGIVDCAPRPIPDSLKLLISRLPASLRWLAVRLLHHARPVVLRLGLKWQSTPIARFRTTLQKWLAHASSSFSRVYVINIAPTVPRVEAHSPGLTKSIDMYNREITEIVSTFDQNRVALIDVYRVINNPQNLEKYINSIDGHHITNSGHGLYADMILAKESAVSNRRSAGIDACQR